MFNFPLIIFYIQIISLTPRRLEQVKSMTVYCFANTTVFLPIQMFTFQVSLEQLLLFGFALTEMFLYWKC